MLSFSWGPRDSKVSDRISNLEQSLETAKREIKNIELEWLSFYDKAKRILARVSQRAKIIERAEAEEAPPAPPPLSIGGASTGRLSDRQREIQQQILRRRAGG